MRGSKNPIVGACGPSGLPVCFPCGSDWITRTTLAAVSAGQLILSRRHRSAYLGSSA